MEFELIAFFCGFEKRFQVEFLRSDFFVRNVHRAILHSASQNFLRAKANYKLQEVVTNGQFESTFRKCSASKRFLMADKVVLK